MMVPVNKLELDRKKRKFTISPRTSSIFTELNSYVVSGGPLHQRVLNLWGKVTSMLPKQT